jgi:Fe-S cluster assembly iron-binding protein IscA
MFALTDHASAAIRELTDRREIPEGGGLRIAADRGSRTLNLSLEPRPRDGDQIVVVHGVPLFLTTEVARLLDDQALDAFVDAAGTVRLAVSHRAA